MYYNRKAYYIIVTIFTQISKNSVKYFIKRKIITTMYNEPKLYRNINVLNI